MESSTGRFMLAIVLMIGVIIGTNLLFPPAPPEPGVPGDSAAVPTAEPVADTAPSASRALEPAQRADSGPQERRETPFPELEQAPPQPEPSAAAFSADTVWVESDLYRYGVSSAGAAIVAAELLPFESFTHEGPVQLAHAEHGPLLGLALQVGGDTLELSSLPFDVIERPEPGGGPLVLRHVDEGRRFAVEVRYEFRPDRYLVDGRVRTSALGDDATLLLRMPVTLGMNEIRPEEDERALAYVVNSTRDGVNSVRLDDVEARRIEEGPLLWAAVKNKYFLVAALAGGPDEEGAAFGGLIAEPVPAENAARMAVTLPATDDAYAFQLYLGPQEHSRLVGVGQNFEHVNTYGWKIFRPIVQPLAQFVLWALDGLHDILGFGYGWILIVFGVLIRLVLWPLNAKAMRSQLKTMELQPVIKEIQAKYKGEPEKMQREMLRLYKEEGFSPLGGCLPMLIPWPVLITLFFVFQNTIAFRGVSFLWLPDLSQPDPLYILPLVMGGSIFILQWLNLRVAPQNNPQMKMMTYLMPIIMVVIFFNLASGLNLYYAASNVASLPQQLQIMQERKKVRARMK